MAEPKQCSMCNEELGVVNCTGCNGYFCWKDIKTHRGGMLIEMDKIVVERDCLHETIKNQIQSNDQQSPLIKQIDQWQNTMIEKIKQIVAQARQQAIQLLNATRIKINTDFKNFSEELARFKKSENYVEHDLQRLKEKIHQFKQDLKQSTQPTRIELHTEQSDLINWDSLIYVEEKQTITSYRSQQQLITGKLINHFSYTSGHIVIHFNERYC